VPDGEFGHLQFRSDLHEGLAGIAMKTADDADVDRGDLRTVHGRLLPVMDGLDCRISSIGMTRPWKKFRHPCFLSRVGASSPRYTECANLMEASDSVKFAVAAGRRDKAHAAGGSAVADAVDAAGLVVRHEQPPVGHHEHVRRSA